MGMLDELFGTAPAPQFTPEEEERFANLARVRKALPAGHPLATDWRDDEARGALSRGDVQFTPSPTKPEDYTGKLIPLSLSAEGKYAPAVPGVVSLPSKAIKALPEIATGTVESVKNAYTAPGKHLFGDVPFALGAGGNIDPLGNPETNRAAVDVAFNMPLGGAVASAALKPNASLAVNAPGITRPRIVPALRRGDEILTGGLNHGEVAAKHDYFPTSRDDSGFAVDGVYHPRDTALDIVKAEEPVAASFLKKGKMGRLESNDLQQARVGSKHPAPLSPAAAMETNLYRYAPPLEGLTKKAEIPGQGLVDVAPFGPARDAALSYMERTGLPYDPPRRHYPIDRQKAEGVAEEFEKMKHDPHNPEVAASYDALINETLGQFDELRKTGLKISFIKPGMKDPYEASPRLVHEDIKNNNHMWVYPTDSGFGKEGFEPTGNPLLRDTGIEIDGVRMKANDVFRIVHDYFGHIKEGVGFRASGEDNAFRQHRAMYSPLARRALTTETRGQNSWLNFGPHGEKNRTAKTADTVFADQKIGLMPEWTTLYANSKQAAPLSLAAAVREDIPFDMPIKTGSGKQTVLNPVRNEFPGIYGDPREIAREAASRVAPEDPALKSLFGVTRDDLYEIGERGTRAGNMEPSFMQGAGRSKQAQQVMTPENAERIRNVLFEGEKYPELIKGMDSWYVMDPAFKRLEQLVGLEEAIKRYNSLNTYMSMASPGSEVLTEINRGTGANFMATQGRFDDFVNFGGIAESMRRGNFPRDLREIVSHPYHKTAHAGPMKKYHDTGKVEMQSAKVPLYMQASGVPETGFQTKLPVPDAHFTRALGVPDVRTAEVTKNASMKPAIYTPIGPWYRDNIAYPLGIEPVPAQARQWGLFAPQTGVDTPIGAPKLELLARRIAEQAHRRGIDPERLRDEVLLGKNLAVNPAELAPLSLMWGGMRD